MAIANLLIKIAADISELKTGSDAAVRAMEKTGSRLDSIGSAIGKSMLAAFSVGAVVSFVDKTLSAASVIHDMGLKLGISSEAVQGFKFAADQAGSSIEAVGTALNKMNLELAQGDKSTVEALKAAGLSFDVIRAMKPEDAFLAITDAIAKISDPMEQVRVGTALMGRGFSELLPAIREGFRAVADGARKMSNETAKDLADAQDRWEEFGNTVTIVSAGILANLTSNSKFTAQFQDNVMKHGWTAAVEFQKAAETIAAASAHVGKNINLTVQPARQSQEEIDKLAATQKKAAAAAEAYAKAFREGVDAMKGTTAIKAAEESLKRLNTATREGFPLQKQTREQQDAINKVMGAAVDVYRAQGKVAPESIRAVHLATLDFSNMVIPFINNYGKALETAGFKILPLINNQERLAKQGVWPQMIHDVERLLPFLEEVPKKLTRSEEVTQSLGSAFAKIPELFMQAFTGGGGVLGAMKAIGVSMADAIMTPLIAGLTKVQRAAIAAGSSTAAAFGGLAGGGTGAKIAGIAAGLGGAALAASSWGAAMTGAGLAGTVALGAATLGIGAAAVGVAILVKKLTDSKGRDAVKKFAESFGGFDPLHKKLSDLGASGEDLWKKLTQGVGSNNPKQAQAAIDEITAALNKQGVQTQALSGIMEEYGFTWEDLGEKARGAKLAELFDTLFEKTQILKDAGIDYSEILKRQSTDYSLLVQAAVRTGAEIPIAMQPILQELIDIGTLVDANGEAFKDLGDVSFAKTLTQGFDSVTTAIYALTDALTNGVGGALDKLGKKSVTIPIKFDVEDMPGGGEIPGFAGGTRGRLLDFGSGTLAMLHGRERVMTEHESLGVSGDGDTYVYIGNEQLDARMVKVARKDASRGGLRPRAAHGRSY